MKKLLFFCVYILVFINFQGCSGQVNNDSIQTAQLKNKLVDTIIPIKHQIKIPEIYKKELADFYSLIINKNIKEDFFKELDNDYSEKILRAILWDEENVNDIIILFFLKLHREYLMKNEKFGYNVSCCRQEHISIMLFSLQYYNISKFDPTNVFLTYYIYEWVLTQPKYFENRYIKEEVESIKKVIKEKKYEYPEHLKLKNSMFFK